MTWSLALYAGSIFATALAGGVAPLVTRVTDERSLKLFISFGAGILIGMACLHMLPDAAQIVPRTFWIWALVGFATLFVVERFFVTHRHDGEDHYETAGVAAFAGLVVHGVIEGFALASTFLLTPLGPLVLLAILAHKAPAGFALTSILRLAGKSARQCVAFALGVAISGPVGVAIAAFLLRDRSLSATAGVLLALSSGTFLYIGCDLLPELIRDGKEKARRAALFGLGILLSYFASFVG